eukprot:909880-Pyramimonas_sp.AAC.1
MALRRGNGTLPSAERSNPKKPRAPWRQAGCFLARVSTVSACSGGADAQASASSPGARAGLHV